MSFIFGAMFSELTNSKERFFLKEQFDLLYSMFFLIIIFVVFGMV